MENIDKLFVINLEHQTERLKEFFEETRKVGIDSNKIEVIKAFNRPHEDSCLGCGISNLTALELAKKRNYKNILICEDDIDFIVDQQAFHHNLSSFFTLVEKTNLQWNVLMLAYNNLETKPFNELIGICKDSRTSAGYLVNACCYDRLIELVQKGVKMQFLTGQHWYYANDVIWKPIQSETDTWFYFMQRIGRQRPFVNSEGVLMQYNC